MPDVEGQPSRLFRFSVRQLDAQEVAADPPNTEHFTNVFDVQLRVSDDRNRVRSYRFLVYRYDFVTPQDMEVLLALPLEFLGVSLSQLAIQQIFTRIIVQVQVIANDGRNSNQDCISILLHLECFQPDQEHDIALALAIQQSMLDTTFNYTVPATKSSIEALHKFRLEDASFASKEPCTICLEHLSSTVEVARMPCLHLYHADCIAQWLNTSHFCPLCRFPMPLFVVVDGVLGK